MRGSIQKALVVGGMEPAHAAALRELHVAVEVVADGSWLSLLRAVRASRPQVILARTAHLKSVLVGRAASVPVVLEAGAADATLSVARAGRAAARTICGGAALRDALLALGATPAKTSLIRGLLPADGPPPSGPRSEAAPAWVVATAPIDEADRGVSDLVLAFRGPHRLPRAAQSAGRACGAPRPAPR